MSNKSVWQRGRVVKEYARYNGLQEPERALLELLQRQLPQMRMLDLGVGAGRTTAHFADLVKEYLGIDYSEEMIRVCKQRFPELSRKGCFAVGDATSMPQLKEKYYDLVLFSFNGIDYMGHEDRITALREIRRVGKPGGYFFFSTHNINCNFAACFKIRLTLNPIKLVYRLGRSSVLRFLNWDLFWKRRRAPYAVIRDGAHGIGLKTYYIHPREQLRQLTELGFGGIQVFSGNTGVELVQGDNTFDTVDDNWLYFLCRF